VRKAITSLFCVLLAGCTAQADTCDRQCLIDLTNDYVAALASGEPAGLPLSDELIMVEDLKRIGTNSGLWQTATGGPGAFAIHVPDPVRQAAGWMGMMERGEEPVLVAIRLQLEGGRIVEAEHLTTSIRPENLPRLRTVRPGFLVEIPESQRLDPGRLIDIAETYYDALTESDGSRAPFADDCERHENGMVAAGGDAGPGPGAAGQPPIARDCAGQLSSNVMAYIDAIENRRVFAADPVTGLVMGLSHFRHSMDFEPYEVTALDGSRIIYGPDRFPFEPFDLPAAHVFKIGPDGRIHEIEAMGFRAPYQSRTGWE
jgi:hypothetical protein